MTVGNPASFGVLLRRHRTAARLTQEELAERAGISLRGLVALENGERLRPHRDTVRLLGDALQLADPMRAQFEAAGRGRRDVPGDDLPRSSAAPLVGRASELELLEWHLAGQGPSVLVLAGEPGIGKTRLLRHAAEQAARRGQVVITGGCQRRSGQEPYAPFPQTLARHLATLPAPFVQRAVRESPWLVRLLPELAPLFSELSATPSLAPGQERRLLFDAVARLLAKLAQPMGMTLFLDDLHWAPGDALDLLTALVHDPACAHLRIVCAYRSTELRPEYPLAVMLADLAHAGLARQREIEGLSPKEAEQLLITLVDELDPESAAVQRAVTRTGGVPFYLVSYAQELKMQGAGSEHDVPWSVAHSLRQRVAALPSVSQEILEVAAVAGREVPRVLLGSLIDHPEKEVLAGMEAACQARLLEEANEHAYQFPHDVIREVIEAELRAARRKALHRRIAEALELLPERTRTGGAAELAWHFLEGDDSERALQYTLLAGDEATTAFAHEEAEQHYRTALELAHKVNDQTRQIEALHQLGVVMCKVGRLEEALAVLEDAAELCRSTGDATAEARAVAEIGRVQERRGAIEQGISRVEPLLQRFEHTDHADRLHLSALAELLLALGDLYYEAGRYLDELAAAERAAGLGRQLGEDHLITDGERQRGLALISLGRREEAMCVWAAALPRMEATRDLYNLSHTLNNLSMGCSDQQQATEYVERALKVAERLGDPSQIAFMTSNLALQEHRAGRWREARSLAERSWELSGPRGLLVSAYAALLLADINLAEGNIADGRRWLETCVTIARDSDMYATRLVQRLLAEQDLLEKHPDLALTRLEPLLDRPGLEEEGVTILLPTLARTYLELGDPERAEAIAQDGLRRATLPGYQDVIAELRLVQGVIAAYNGRWEDAQAGYEEALTVARRRPYPYAEGLTLYEYGLMENRRSQPERARELLEEARLVFRRLGAQPHVERTDLALANLQQAASTDWSAGPSTWSPGSCRLGPWTDRAESASI